MERDAQPGRRFARHDVRTRGDAAEEVELAARGIGAGFQYFQRCSEVILGRFKLRIRAAGSSIRAVARERADEGGFEHAGELPESVLISRLMIVPEIITGFPRH